MIALEQAVGCINHRLSELNGKPFGLDPHPSQRQLDPYIVTPSIVRAIFKSELENLSKLGMPREFEQPLREELERVIDTMSEQLHTWCEFQNRF